MEVAIRHLPDRSRFVAAADGLTAFLEYEVNGSAVAMTHTVVPPQIGGRGIGGELTRTAVAWARKQSLAIDAQCSYVREWLAEHPEA